MDDCFYSREGGWVTTGEKGPTLEGTGFAFQVCATISTIPGGRAPDNLTAGGCSHCVLPIVTAALCNRPLPIMQGLVRSAFDDLTLMGLFPAKPWTSTGLLVLSGELHLLEGMPSSIAASSWPNWVSFAWRAVGLDRLEPNCCDVDWLREVLPPEPKLSGLQNGDGQDDGHLQAQQTHRTCKTGSCSCICTLVLSGV